MSVTPADFKVRFPEFASEADARIQVFIDDATATVNPCCPNVDLMICYLTAHLLTLANATAGGSTDTIKPLASESVGDVSRSFGGTASKSSGDNFYASIRRKIFRSKKKLYWVTYYCLITNNT